jgi:hypothetical protein
MAAGCWSEEGAQGVTEASGVPPWSAALRGRYGAKRRKTVGRKSRVRHEKGAWIQWEEGSPPGSLRSSRKAVVGTKGAIPTSELTTEKIS